MSTRPFAVALLAATAALAAAAAPAATKPYPTNRCVAVKQKEAGRYCRRALQAWADWAVRQDAGQRDAATVRALGKLEARWTQAEVRAADRGVDCAETTLDRDALVALLDATVTGLVGQVTDGLDLGDPDQATCGRRLLIAAARACESLLGAESTFVNNLGRDPSGATRAASREKAEAAFAVRWADATAGACPTGATREGVESAVEEAVAAVVRDTVVSPHVDDARFTTISPTGTTSYLGRALEPTCIGGTPYHYFVKRGSVNKLVVYYQGGGACWDQLTCGVPVCDSNVNPAGNDNPNIGGGRGFADPNNPENPFRDWNFVFVSYCSCDIHFGDAAQDYANVNAASPLHIEHRGYQNARVVEKWAREHFVNPEAVFVTGSSAGAYGAWFHAPLLQEVWPASRFHVLADAGNGVITAEFRQQYFPNWNFAANFPKDIPGLQELITSGAGIPEYTELVAPLFPNTTWAHYTTAYDGGSGGQTGFYNVMLNDNDPLAALTWWNGSCAFNAQMRAQAIATAAAIPSNYRYYIGTGSRHTMWGSNKVYNDTSGGVPRVVDWVEAMLRSGNGAADPAWTNVECASCGLLLAGDPRPNPLVPPFVQQGSDVVVDCGLPGAAFVE